MASFYVCTTHDIYDPSTGIFTMVRDCILWDTDVLGPYNGTTYSSEDECYNLSDCVRQNNCDRQIELITLVSKTNNSVTLTIELQADYDDTHLEYAILDINHNIIQNWIQISSNALPRVADYTISINTSTHCLLAFRLVKECYGTTSSGGNNNGI